MDFLAYRDNKCFQIFKFLFKIVTFSKSKKLRVFVVNFFSFKHLFSEAVVKTKIL